MKTLWFTYIFTITWWLLAPSNLLIIDNDFAIEHNRQYEVNHTIDQWVDLMEQLPKPKPKTKKGK